MHRSHLVSLVLALSASLSATACATAPPTTTTFGQRPPQISPAGPRAVAIVRVRAPWYAPRFAIRSKFHDVLGEYEALPALQAKYFTITDGGEFGGIYLWDTRADVERHFDAAWHARVKEKRGVDGDVLVMDAPFVVDGPALPHGTATGRRSLDYRAWASFVLWRLPEGRDPAAAAQILAARPAPAALIRAFVVTEARGVGLVALWATREGAEGDVTEATRAAVGKTIGAGESERILFEAPLLIDATLVER